MLLLTPRVALLSRLTQTAVLERLQHISRSVDVADRKTISHRVKRSLGGREREGCDTLTMAQVEARPVPAKRRNLVKRVDTSSKADLVQSFVGFNHATVTEGHVQLARQCIKLIPLRDARYDHVPFSMIIQWNEVHNIQH